jgi:signal transduction histidine kinase
MTWNAAPFLITTLSYLMLGGWVIAQRKNRIQNLYGLFSLATALWQGIWVILFVFPNATWRYEALKICYSGIILIPPIFYQLVSEWVESKKNREWLWATYGTSCLLILSVWTSHLFLSGFNQFVWGLSAKAGILHPVFVFLVLVVIGRTLILLQRIHLDPMTVESKKRQMTLVKVATYIYYGGALDMLSNYGFSIFPFSFLFTGLAVVLFGHAMFRYEFLKVAVALETEQELARRQAASDEMKRLGMSAAFPLVSQGELLGFLLLGEKMSEESYSKEDLLLLRIVANQAALAYQRVRFLEMAVHGARTEMLGEIAGGFAHEIKTPLANISLPAELSLMDLIDLEKGKRSIEDVMPELKSRLKDIMTQAFKASEKIEAIRQFSKPGQVRLTPVELIKIFQNSLGLLDHLLKKHRVRIVTQFPETITPIRGDAKQLEIVFVNLIKNAVEAMAQNVSTGLARELVLGAREEADWVIATVKDSGPGIKRADFGHLFEAYFTTKGSEGTGMGLFLSHQVIKAHGGAIDCKSEEGQGTEFIIRLPKYSEETMGVKAA